MMMLVANRDCVGIFTCHHHHRSSSSDQCTHPNTYFFRIADTTHIITCHIAHTTHTQCMHAYEGRDRAQHVSNTVMIEHQKMSIWHIYSGAGGKFAVDLVVVALEDAVLVDVMERCV